MYTENTDDFWTQKTNTDYFLADFKAFKADCTHSDSQILDKVQTWAKWSVYLSREVNALKESSFDQNQDVPLEEHWNTLLEDEAMLFTPFSKSTSGIAELRKSMIEWIFNLGDKLKQRSLTLQLAIVYIDKLFQQGKLEDIGKQKYLWSLTALLLASKYDEIDENIPFIRNFKKASSKANFSYSEVIKCQDIFVKTLKWNLMIVSPLNYTYALLTFGVVFSNDKFKYKQSQIDYLQKIQTPESQNKDKMLVIADNKIKSIRKYCEFYTDMALQSYDCQQYKYSVQALSAVIAARRTCGVKPIWNKWFKEITGYSYTDIEEWFNKLYLKYEKFFCKSKDNNKNKLVKAKSQITKISSPSSSVSKIDYKANSSLIREKTMSVLNKSKDKIGSLKENNPVISVSQKSSMLKDRSNSSSYKTNPQNNMKSFLAPRSTKIDSKLWTNYFSK